MIASSILRRHSNNVLSCVNRSPNLLYSTSGAASSVQPHQKVLYKEKFADEIFTDGTRNPCETWHTALPCTE